MKRAIELFCGTKSFSKVAKNFYYDTLTVDCDARHNPDWLGCVEDIRELPTCDIVWASPPCTCFSIASVSTHWNKDKTPKSQACKDAMWTLDHTIYLISRLVEVSAKEGFLVTWYIENPRGMMRKVIHEIFQKYKVKHYAQRSVCYCQYGDIRMKPTDIWTNDINWKPMPMCKNNNPNCNHQRAPRGSKTGTQGLKNNIERGRIPHQLFYEIFCHRGELI